MIKRCVTYRHGVKEEAHKRDQETDDQALYQAHLVVVPQHRLQALDRVHHIHEGSVGSAVGLK